MGRYSQYGAGPAKKVKSEQADIDYLPHARPYRRRPLSDEFDRECGLSYEHTLVFVRFVQYGAREYECSNCGERTLQTEYSCDPDIHEMIEVGALELAFQPIAPKSRKTLLEMAQAKRDMQNRREGKQWVKDDEEVDLDA